MQRELIATCEAFVIGLPEPFSTCRTWSLPFFRSPGLAGTKR
jgi:hypothetical protein